MFNKSLRGTASHKVAAQRTTCLIWQKCPSYNTQPFLTRAILRNPPWWCIQGCFNTLESATEKQSRALLGAENLEATDKRPWKEYCEGVGEQNSYYSGINEQWLQSKNLSCKKQETSISSDILWLRYFFGSGETKQLDPSLRGSLAPRLEPAALWITFTQAEYVHWLMMAHFTSRHLPRATLDRRNDFVALWGTVVSPRLPLT